MRSIAYTMTLTHFITFGTNEYKVSGLALRQQAARYFEAAHYFDESVLDGWNLRALHPASQIRKGHGLWLWKPYVLLKYMRHAANLGDVIVYCDAGYQMNGNLAAVVCGYFAANPTQTICVLRDHHFAPGRRFLEIEWTKQAVFKFFDIEPKSITDSADPEQAWAGFVAVKNTLLSQYIITKWLDACTDPNMLLLDVPDDQRSKELPQFREHRHDQSVLSMLCRKWGIKPVQFPDGAFLMERLPKKSYADKQEPDSEWQTTKQ